MPHDRSSVRIQPDTHESLGELLRSRALASSPRLLIGQAVAGMALNAALMVWHPERWGIATAAMATVALHALWSVAVQRATVETDDAGMNDAALVEQTDAESSITSPRRAHRGWWFVRRTSAIAASAAALLLLWFVCMMLLGRLIS